MQRGRSVWIGGLIVLVMLGASCGRSADQAEVGGVSVTPETTAVPPAAPTPTEAPPATQITYVVQSGDSLSVIATRFGVGVAELADFNAIGDVNAIVVGQELTIPPVSATTTTATP